MKLNHIDLQMSDVDAAREFFEKFFDLASVRLATMRTKLLLHIREARYAS